MYSHEMLLALAKSAQEFQCTVMGWALTVVFFVEKNRAKTPPPPPIFASKSHIRGWVFTRYFTVLVIPV